MNTPEGDAPTLSYADLADLLELHFGVRPALVTLRAAAQRQKGPAAPGRAAGSTASITAGIPAPLPDRQGFDAADVAVWIADHPWRARATAYERLSDTSATEPEQRQAAVKAAREAGLSWSDVARAIAIADGVTFTRQAAQQRYGSRNVTP